MGYSVKTDKTHTHMHMHAHTRAQRKRQKELAVCSICFYEVNFTVYKLPGCGSSRRLYLCQCKGTRTRGPESEVGEMWLH